MRRVIQTNIDRLKELLKTEADPTKRAMELRLLAEEEAAETLKKLLPWRRPHVTHCGPGRSINRALQARI